MRLFGRKPAREGARPALSRAATGVSVGDWPRSYEAQVRDGYGGNAIAQRAVKLVAESVAAAPVVASEPALAALVRARTGGQALLESVAAQMLLHGNAYVQLLRDGDGEIAALYALRPERVTAELDAAGWPTAYVYRVGERRTRLDAEGARPAVVHLRGYNPTDDHYGMGCLGAAAGAVAVHNAAARWNKALLDNAARPSGALVYDPHDGAALSPDQFARLRSEMEAGFAGAGNAGRPMLLEGGLRWQPLSLSPADMDFVGLKAAAAREIALAFGVPPMLLGLPGDATYANYREANRALWRLTVLPLAETILAGLAQGLAGWFADASLRVDLDRAPALSEDRERLRVFTAPPLRASLPRVVLEDAVLAAADAVGVSGRVGTIGVTCTDSGEQPDRLRALVEQVETAMAAIPPDLGAGWRLAALTLTRSRIAHGKEVRGDARSERGEQWTATCVFAVRMFRIN